MAQIDTNFALKLFRKQTGRIPTGQELVCIKQLIITVPFTTSYEDYQKFWEEEMVNIKNRQFH